MVMHTIAVIGATGNVGREMLRILAERNFPIKQIIALASERSVGKEIAFGNDKVLKVQNLATFDFTGVDLALSSPGAAVSARYTPKATMCGCIVIDNTSHFRMESDVPLVVPEVNPQAIAHYRKRNIIANPNCSTIQMVVALQPLHNAFKIKRVIVSTYQSTSGAGKKAMDELSHQSSLLMKEHIKESSSQRKFAKQIAFNLIPHIDSFMEDGATREEWKMAMETRKILDSSIAVHANCCRVPTFIGHAEYINIETERPLSVADARNVLARAPGVMVIDSDTLPTARDYMTPVESTGTDFVYVSRLRLDHTIDHGLSFWCVADNLRKGAALNAIQIAEILVRNYTYT